MARSATVAVLRCAIELAALLLLGALANSAHAQLSPTEAALIQNGIGPHVEALTILGGDFGLSDGEFHSREGRGYGLHLPVDTSITKFGGDGEVGSPKPLNILHIRWQPLVQGNMGYLQSRTLPQGLGPGAAMNEFRSVAVEFGGGARLWTSDRFSFAPTVMVLYGHTDDDYVVANASGQPRASQLRQLGLIDWSIDTWSLRPALNVQYIFSLSHTVVTLSSDAVGFFTQGFFPSNAQLQVGGDSGFVTNKIDLDIPLDIDLYGYPLHTGGYLSRTDLLGDLRQGLGVQHLNELHGRLVLDVLNRLWGVQWIGLGASYIWGTNISGWTAGADVEFHF